MARIFSDDFKELVRSRTDIVSLIGESVALQSRGREFVGLCPFHEDHNPSLRVYPDRQSFRCWSCQEGGDCFSFVIKHERVEFREALEMLAARANVPMPAAHRDHRPGQDGDSKKRLYEVLAWAETEFHEYLLNTAMGERARRYLADRGLTSETIARFRLGYHPDNSRWLIERARNRFTPDELLAVRLIGQREEAQRDGGGGYYDNFRDRVLFPIRDSQRRPVGFGGRILPDSPNTAGPKYWNSPESPVFNKSRLLYALDLAREAITKADTSVVMEGYTDCIMAHQCGVTNVVATLGTALAETHVVVLKRFGRKVVLVYDGDLPGRNAAERSVPKFLAHEVDLRILTLPDDLDPADYLTRFGGASFSALLEQAPEAWDYKFRIVKERYGLESIDARHRVLQEMLETLCQTPAQASSGSAGSWQMRESVIVGKLSQRLSISEPVIRQRLNDLRSGGAHGSKGTPAVSLKTPVQEDLFPRIPSKEDLAERDLLGIIFIRPETIDSIRQRVPASELSNASLRELFELCLQLADEGASPSYDRVLAALEDTRRKALVTLIDEYAQEVRETLSLNLVLDHFQRRRESNDAASARVNGPHLPENQAGLSQDARTRLRAATETNKKRIIKQTLT